MTDAHGRRKPAATASSSAPTTELPSPATEDDSSKRPEFVTALARGLDVLGSFEPEHKRMTLSRVAERTTLTRGTARRFLLTLQELGYLDSDGKHFWLTPKVFRFSNAYLASFGVGEGAQAILKELSEKLGEATSMAVLDGADIVYVARTSAPRTFATSFNLHVGTRLPAFCSSLGRVLLSRLDDSALDNWLRERQLLPLTDRTVTDRAKLRAIIKEVRQQGYAIVNGEMEIGLRSMAVPIPDGTGQPVAALNVATLAARTSLDTLRKSFLPVMRAAAIRIGRLLDYQWPNDG
jgi:IclR family pca regulon transcriptional regulator